MSIEHIAVIGAGTMGTGIAQVAAIHGCRVRLIDVNSEVLERAIEEIRSRLESSVAKGRLSADERSAILKRITASGELADIADVSLAIEAVVEDLESKVQVFQALEQATSADAVLATNTSSLRVSKIAEAVEAPERVVGMHFFNPAPVMPLVEVIAAERADERSLDLVTQVAREWGKIPVRAKDTPGFIVNRVARGFYLEALRMLGEGVAGVAAIDAALRTLGTFRMGPFRLMDLVGLDVNYAVSCSVWEQSGRPARLKPHDIQRELVEQNRLGRKSRRGFYRYESDPPVVNVERSITELDPPEEVSRAVTSFVQAAALCDADTLSNASMQDRYVFARILATIMNEAALALDEQVASAADIDTAMRHGTNYPKGPLRWAEQVGYGNVARLLLALSDDPTDCRFAPARLFVE